MFEFPSYYRIPLVESIRQLLVASYPLGVIGVYDGF